MARTRLGPIGSASAYAGFTPKTEAVVVESVIGLDASFSPVIALDSTYAPSVILDGIYNPTLTLDASTEG